jgi:UDP-glucuronate decarboxylase
MLPNDGRVVSNFIVQALKDSDITIYGDGSQTRSFCCVTDLVAGLEAMMRTPDGVTGPVNLGNPGEFTVRELAETIIRITGSKSKIVYKPLPQDDPARRKPDVSLARELLGWTPSVSLEDGLRQTIDYFRNLEEL